MRRSTVLLMGTPLIVLAGVVLVTPSSHGGDIGFVEDFALAKDRSAALKQLIPGTEDYYYYHCLHYLNSGQLDKVEPMTRLWYERHRQTARLTEIQTRHALLNYDKDPKSTLDYVRSRLNLSFNHQKEVVGAVEVLPTLLDAKLISRDTLRAMSLKRGNLHNFEETALDWLAAENLNWELRRQLLSWLKQPDAPNLAKLVADDLASPHPVSFGAYPVHRQMTLAQLDELLKLRASTLNETAFVSAYVTKLQPGTDDDWKRDRKLAKAFLERVQSFVDKLDVVHNPLKAHVLYHRLVFDRAEGTYSKDRLIEYLKLPRNQPYMAKRLLDSVAARDYPATLEADYAAITLMPKVGDDSQLVRSYLLHFLVDAESTKDFDPYINDVVLKHMFAEAKLVNGLGDNERWASMLPPEALRSLKERVDIDFAFTNKTDVGVNEPIKLEVFVKNAPTLLVKVYEINARHFYRTHGREIDTDINLDGLVANAERVITGNADPFRRSAVTIELPDPKGTPNFPEANRPGVYVVDLIGGGKRSRALIRKGRLHPVVTTGTAGQVVRVVDELKKPVPDATLWLGQVEYKADKDGTIHLPFSTSPGKRPLVLSRGDFACLDYLDHQPEAYQLTAGIHVDRESLLSQRIAPIFIRPGLKLNGEPVSVKLLEEVRVRITSTEHDGVPSSVAVPNFKLFEDRESIHEVRVPPRLSKLEVTLSAKVKNLSTGKTVDLIAAQAFAVSEFARTDKIEDLHLAKFGPNYVIELLGRTGEAKPDRPVRLSIKQRDFKEPVTVTLKTDPKGRVYLGALIDVTSVTATNPDNTAHTWNLLTDRHTYRQLMHAKAGEVIVVPHLGAAGKPSRDEYGLFEVRGDMIRADKFSALAIENGMVELRGLAPGDYDLYLKRSGEKVRVRVADGAAHGGHVLNSLRHLELPALKPVQIESVTADKDTISVNLRNATKYARVHVFATRYHPAFSAFGNLSKVRDSEPDAAFPLHAESVYLTGRNIGDEYRYVLERRGQKKFPGNMLARPELLLNPWAVRLTETGEQVAIGGDQFGKGGGVTPAGSAPPPPEPKPEPNVGPLVSDFADLDFLYDASAVAVNLTADDNGLVKLARKDVGPHAFLHVVACDPLNTTFRTASLAEAPANFVDLRLKNGLDPTKHFTQQKQVTVAEAGKVFAIEDIANSKFEAYDSLAKVYSLYATISKDPKLAEFAFVLRWPTLKPEQKRELYSKYACHELSFFLSKKDPEFFKAVVKPHLTNKKDKTFLDHFLLDGDVKPFAEPWAFGRLNVTERVLLSQRIAGEPARTTRHLDDLLKLIPRDSARELFLFNVAVENTALDFSTNDPFAQTKTPGKNPDVLPTNPGAPPPAPVVPAPPGGLPVPGAGGPPGLPAQPGRDSKGKDGYGGEKGGKSDPKATGGDNKKRDEDRFYENDREKFIPRALYRKLDPTMEWAENNYYKLLIKDQIADLVKVNRFWFDYSLTEGKGTYLSRNLPVASSNFTEMMFALSMLDLPFEPAKHEVKFAAGKMSLTPGSRMIAFHEEVRPAEGKGGQLPILVSQNFYRHGDRFREEGGEKYDKFVTEEFVVHTVYGCQVVVTNPTSSRQKLSVLLQLPTGALSVAGGRHTKAVQLDLEPYHTKTIDYLFYFPIPGKYPHFPVHVAKNELHVTAAQPFSFNVVGKATKLDTTAWDYVSQHGTNEEVLAFMVRENVRALNLDKIAFRVKDRDFFSAVIKLLQDRHLYQNTLYSYAIHHGDTGIARQFLMHQDGFVNEAGGPIDSPLLFVDPVARHTYEHLEYKPLVNARAHALGKRRQIVNDRLFEQCHRFLKVLSYHKELNDTDLAAVTYYLLLQDRIDEAFDTFARVNRDKVTTKMQYDYCAAYLQLFDGDLKQARAIAAKYAEYPVDRWKHTFAAITSQLDEIEGKNGKVVDPNDRNQNQGNLAATEPGFEFTIDGKAINLTWQNLDSVKVNYYPMDVELLFSTSPFVQQSGGQFASIRPNATKEIKLPEKQNKLVVPLPEEFASKNVLVEIVAAGKTRAVPYYATAMTVNVTENYGHLRVTDTAGGKVLSKVYVKVYAKLADGTVKFHKDGYTDLRGRFDYVSVNTPERQAIEKFSVLVLSEDRGALIREVAPPQR